MIRVINLIIFSVQTIVFLLEQIWKIQFTIFSKFSKPNIQLKLSEVTQALLQSRYIPMCCFEACLKWKFSV